MSDLNHTPRPDPLDRAAAALRERPVPLGPPPELLAATVAALQSRSSPAYLAQQRRRRMIRYVSYGTATAAAVGLVALAVVFGTATRAPAAELAEALENLDKAKSYKHVTKMTFGGKTMFEMTTYKQGERMRFEAGKDVAIVVDEKGEAVQFNHAGKTVMKLDLKAMQKDMPKASEEAEGLAKKIRDLKGEGVERLGEEVLGGKKTVVYAFKDVKLEGTSTDWKVWVDPKRKMLVRMEHLQKGDKDTEAVITSEYGGWDEEFDASLFSLDAPAGYTWAVEPKKK